MRRLALVSFVIVLVLPVAAGSAARRGLALADYYTLKTVTDPRLSPDGERVAFTVTSADQKLNRRMTSIWMAPTDGSAPAAPFTTAQSASGPRWSPDGRRLAFLSARPDGDASASAPAPRSQVYVIGVDGGGEARKVTSLPEGVDSFEWSPDGRSIACLGKTTPPVITGKSDRTDVRHYLHSAYKADGVGFDDGKRGQVWVVEIETGNALQVTSGDRRSASEGPEWSPDGTRIAYVAMRTDADAEESVDVWVVPASGGEPVKVSDTGFRIASPRWSPDGRRIAYIGAQDWEAIPKIRLAPAEGGHSAILAGDLTFMTQLEWSADGRSLFVQVPLKGEEHVVRIDISTGAVAPVTSGPRVVRRPDINEQAGLLAYVAGDVSHPDEVSVAELNGRGERRISHVNDALVDQLELPGVERFAYASVDGWEVDGFLMKPVGWQPGRTYPAILNIHGGPNGMFGLHWNPDFQVLAASGYAVFYTNPRGSSGYGERFQRGVAMEWGGKAYEDVMNGVDAMLARAPWVDRARLGVTGHSYGGFMTDWIVGHTDRFKAAVSISGISDFVSVEGTRDGFYGHAKDFGGGLFDGFETYWNFSPLKYVGRVKTPVLLLHGEMDLRVPLSQGEEFFRGLRHFGVTSELVVFPREPHTPRREPRHQVEVMEWMVYWFDRLVSGDQSAVRPNGRD